MSQKKSLGKSLDKLKKLDLLNLSESLGLGSQSSLRDNSRNKLINKTKKEKKKLTNFVNKSVFVISDNEAQKECAKKLKKYGARIRDISNAGTYGSISDVCFSKNRCPYVIKAQRFDYDDRPYKTEIEIMKKIEGKGIMPKLIDHWECKYKVKLPGVEFERPVIVGYIVQEKWDGNLRELIIKQKGLKVSQLKAIIKLLQKLHNEKIIHGDPHPGNFVYKYIKSKSKKTRAANREPKIKFAMIDFGLSFDFSKKLVGRYRPFFRGEAFTGKRYVDHDFNYLDDSLLFLLNIDASDVLKKYYNRNNIYPHLSIHVENTGLLPG